MTRRPPTPRSRIRSELRRLEAMLPSVLARDRHAALEGLLRRDGGGRRGALPEAGQLQGLRRRLERSAGLRARRAAGVPAPDLLPELPITARRDDIVRAVKDHRVVVVSGETGSGKTTQIPKFCLAAGRGVDGWIGCTQPRRIAAMSVAERMAEEFGEPVGRSVGYKIRFQDAAPPSAYVKVVTDGVLLAEARGDPLLSRYDTLIVDEAHERSLNIDFVLGLVKRLLDRRDDLKLIVTSATIDTEKFSRAFDDAPVIEVSGRLYPVEVRYRPPEAVDGEEGSHVEAAVDAVASLWEAGASGDVLVFMPTEQDIREACELIEARGLPRSLVLPLFARLSAAEQRRVFVRVPERKIVVATNVAETSITIPGIRYVVDTGLARVARYSPRTRTTGLPVVPVARSSADQRAGRCGRLRDGVCIRLYGEEDYAGRPRFTPPEVLRSNLAEVILRMIALDLGAVETFPFIDPPDGRSVKDGLALLHELGALERDEAEGGHRLTPEGRLMSRLPVDPRLARMLIEARREGCLEAVTVLAAALSIQDPRERPAAARDAADRAHARFQDPESDFVTLLRIWEACEGASVGRSRFGALKRFCRESFLSFRRMREWQDVHRQLAEQLAEADLPAPGPTPSAAAGSGADRFGALYGAIHRSVLSGFLSNIAQKREKNLYRATKGREAMLFPGSGLFNRAGEWIVAAEMVETSRLFARTAAHIDPRWLEPLAGHLCRRTHLDPRWERRRGAVVASEQVTLFGLVIEPGRTVPYGPAHPEEATEIFIRSALVEEDVRKPLPFMRHNRERIEAVRAMEDRLRRRGIFAGDDALFDFYRSRLDGVWDIRTLNRRIRTRGDAFLRLSEEDLLRDAPGDEELALYPDRVSLGASRFPVRYRFDPGAEEDGVTVTIPEAAAPGIDEAASEWLVPGLLREKLAHLIRGLPKSYRRRLVPIGDTVERLVRELPRDGGSLVAEVSRWLQRRHGMEVPGSAWPSDPLPDHLRMRFRLTGADGRDVRSGRDPSVLRGHAPSAGAAPSALTRARERWEREGLTAWEVGTLPDTVGVDLPDGARWSLFPALAAAPSAESVSLRLLENRDDALAAHRAGVGALYRIRFRKALRQVRRQAAFPRAAAERVPYPGGARAMEERIFDRAFRDLFHRDIRSAEDFERWGDEALASLPASVRGWLDAAVPVLEAVAKVRGELFDLARANPGNRHAAELTGALGEALLRLVPAHFVDLYEADRLPHLVRYAAAVGIRARRAVEDPRRDGIKAAEVEPVEGALQRFLAGLDPRTSPRRREAVEALHWEIEEYKVSVFAQELGTAHPVSRKRILARIRDIERMV